MEASANPSGEGIGQVMPILVKVLKSRAFDA
jgi:hypothetical protein